MMVGGWEKEEGRASNTYSVGCGWWVMCCAGGVVNVPSVMMLLVLCDVVPKIGLQGCFIYDSYHLFHKLIR